MSAIDISQVASTSFILTSDYCHIVRNNDYSVGLSYKSLVENFSELYGGKSALSSFDSEITSLLNELSDLSSTMITKSEANSVYVSKDALNAKKDQLLTYDTMTTIVSKYVTEDDAKNRAAQVRAEAQQFADEIIDFAAAAMVGVNQSTASYITQ